MDEIEDSKGRAPAPVFFGDAQPLDSSRSAFVLRDGLNPHDIREHQPILTDEPCANFSVPLSANHVAPFVHARNQADCSMHGLASPASALGCRQAGNLEISSLLLPCQRPLAQAPTCNRTARVMRPIVLCMGINSAGPCTA